MVGKRAISSTRPMSVCTDTWDYFFLIFLVLRNQSSGGENFSKRLSFQINVEEEAVATCSIISQDIQECDATKSNRHLKAQQKKPTTF
jgi:hypothetical protein